MLKQFKLAAAVVTAAVAATTFASAASANPVDLFMLSSAANQYQFGNSCTAGMMPGTFGSLDWRTNAPGVSGAPQLDGTLCLQNTTDETRLKVIYHDSAGTTITRFVTPSLTGSGGPLDKTAILAGGPRVSYGILDHVHIDIEHRAPGGNWILAGTSMQFP